MARLDSAISKLLSNQGLELAFEAGRLPELRTADTTAQFLKQELSETQLIALFAEIVPPAHRGSFPTAGVSKWPYVSPHGTVFVRFEKGPARTRASIRTTLDEGMPQPSAPSTPPRARTTEARAASPSPEPTPSEAEQPSRINRPPPPVADASLGARRLHLVGTVHERPTVLPSDPAEAMQALLRLMLKRKASDLHLTSGAAPMYRIDGDMQPETGGKPVSPENLRAMLWSIAPKRNREEWEQRHDSDFAYELDDARFRVNLFLDRNGIGAVLRHIPTQIRSAEDLGLAPALLELCSLNKGLVLVTGPTGSGKSTTLAAMIDYINRNRSDHIITIEDPIEFVHENKRCLVNQREVGIHTGSFKDALRAALREDPDVVLVGELRDLETISIALETAETGHLVFGTLHTNTAASTIDRIIDQFPSDRQQQVRLMLSESLRGVVAQTLCKRVGGGRAAAQEILVATPSISNLIREAKTFQVPSMMQTGRNVGMVTLNDALLDLVKRGVIDPAEALKKSVARAELKQQLDRLESAGAGATSTSATVAA